MKSKSRYSVARCLLALGASASLFLATSLSAKDYELDQYGGWTGIKGKKTGFFHLEEIEGRNWFVTPDGNVFYPVALSHMLSGETRTAAKTLFGDDKEAWVRDSVAKARDMGFNCALGASTSPERNLNGYVDLPLSEKVFEEEEFPYAVGVILMKHAWEFVEGVTLPDIFDPAYKQLIEDRAKVELVYGKDFGRANYPSVGKRLDPVMVEDFNEIVSRMCIHLYKMAHAAIRRYDQNHLILGSFIKEWGLTGESWKAAAPYLDLIAPQHWNEEIDISDLSYAAGLPMIVSDEDVGFHYPNNKGNLYKGLVSHEARGEIYQATMMRHYKDPQTLGATFCMCLYDQELAVVHKDQETGIYTIDGKAGLISRIREINTQIYEHAPNPTDRKGLEKLDETLRQLWKKRDTRPA